MAEYIEREAFVHRLMAQAVTDDLYGMGMKMGFDIAASVALQMPRRKIPAADVVEVKRGQNLRDGGIFECSLCGWMDWDTMLADGPFNFCPNCGARMEVDHAAD